MTEPIPQIISRDPEAHAKLDRIERALMGDLATGTPGYMERQRQSENEIRDHAARLERHSQRLHVLEDRPAQASQWAVKTIAEKLATLAAAGLVGWLAGKPH